MVNLSDKEYRALPVESYSSLKYLLGTRQEYELYKKNPFKGNDSTLLGTAVHHFLQGNRHLVLFHNKSKAESNVEIQNMFMERVGEDGIIIPKSCEEKINKIMSNANDNPKITHYMDNAFIETTYQFEIDGVPLKAKLDWETENEIVDIKTTGGETTAEGFRWTAYAAHYDLQAAVYQTAVHKSTGILKPYRFVVASTREPFFQVNTYPVSQKFLDSGYEKLRRALDRYKRFVINGEEWVDYEEEI